jgi:hypothetical protein
LAKICWQDLLGKIWVGRPMRCMACGNNMRLVRVVLDHAMAVPGFKTQTLKCSGCGDSEQRLVFDRPSKFEPFHEAPPVAIEHEADLREGEAVLRQAMEKVSGPDRVEARSAWKRTVAKLRGKADGDL